MQRISAAIDATGAPKPTPKSPHPIRIPKIYDAGILKSIDERIPFTSENVVCPEPINKPLKQKNTGAVR